MFRRILIAPTTLKSCDIKQQACSSMFRIGIWTSESRECKQCNFRWSPVPSNIQILPLLNRTFILNTSYLSNALVSCLVLAPSLRPGVCPGVSENGIHALPMPNLDKAGPRSETVSFSRGFRVERHFLYLKTVKESICLFACLLSRSENQEISIDYRINHHNQLWHRSDRYIGRGTLCAGDSQTSARLLRQFLDHGGMTTANMQWDWSLCWNSLASSNRFKMPKMEGRWNILILHGHECKNSYSTDCTCLTETSSNDSGFFTSHFSSPQAFHFPTHDPLNDPGGVPLRRVQRWRALLPSSGPWCAPKWFYRTDSEFAFRRLKTLYCEISISFYNVLHRWPRHIINHYYIDMLYFVHLWSIFVHFFNLVQSHFQSLVLAFLSPSELSNEQWVRPSPSADLLLRYLTKNSSA